MIKTTVSVFVRYADGIGQTIHDLAIHDLEIDKISLWENYITVTLEHKRFIIPFNNVEYITIDR